MHKNPLFSSKSDLWGTPPELFRLLNQAYEFQLDAASTDENRLCENYFTKKDNGLLKDWHPFRRVWLNPPYGKTIGQWMKKAFEESQKGCIVVCLVPARVDTRWWHDNVEGKASVTFFKGRLKYLNYTNGSSARSNGATFPSALVIYGPDIEQREKYSHLPIRHN